MHEGLLRGDTPPQRRDVAAHRARRDRAGQRQQQPADPLRGQPPVLAQPLLDPVPPRVQATRPRRRHPHRRRRPAYRAAHRLDVQLQPPRDLLLRYPFHQMQVADLGPLTHPDHLRVLLAESTRRRVSSRRSIATGTPFRECSGGPFSDGHGVPVPFSVTPRDGSHGVGQAAGSTDEVHVHRAPEKDLCPGGSATDGCPVGSLRRRAPVQGPAGIGARPFDSADGRLI